MIPPFADHPLIREFNEIKKYFRRHETSESRSRLRQFRNYARDIKASGGDVAFDFVGSQNFGQATRTSDADVVIYLRCADPCEDSCPNSCVGHAAIHRRLIQALRSDKQAGAYDVQVIDTINLTELDQALTRGEVDSHVLLRFAFYRSICRAVNIALLRPYQTRLMENRALIESMQPQLRELFDGLCSSSKHHLSFNKYQERLAQMGIQIPGIMRAIIRRHQEDDSLLPPDSD